MPNKVLYLMKLDMIKTKEEMFVDPHMHCLASKWSSALLANGIVTNISRRPGLNALCKHVQKMMTSE